MLAPIGLTPQNTAGTQSREAGPHVAPDSPEQLLPALNNADTLPAQNGENLVEPVRRINEAMKAYGLQFDLNRGADRIVTRIIDTDSGEIIRQIPSDTVLHISERLGQVVGLLLEESA